MASIIKIIKGTTEISLLNLSGFHLRDHGWDMNPADQEKGIVRERIRCSLLATSKDNAAAQLQQLNDMLADAALYSRFDPVQNVPVFIETQHLNETNRRYAQIAGDYVRFKRSPYDKVAQIDSNFEEVDLVITREHPWRSHKPGILPGRLPLDEVDGPAYSPDATDYSVDVESSFGHIPTTMTGGIIGRPGQFGHGVQVAEATINIMRNPQFYVNVTDDWLFNQGGVGGSVARDATIFTIGLASAKIVAGNNFSRIQKINLYNLGNGNDITLSLKMRCGSDPTGNKARAIIYDATTPATRATVYATVASVGEFEYLTCSWNNNTGGAVNISVYIINDFDDSVTAIWADEVQLEEKSYPTPYCDGSLGLGHSWSGVAHNSTSNRTAHVLRHTIDDVSLEGTISFRMKTIYEEDEVGSFNRVFCLTDGTANNRLRFYVDHVNDRYVASYVGNGTTREINASATDIVRLIWAHVVITWDVIADELKLFIDGAQISTTQTGLVAPSAAWDRLFIGARHDGADQWSGWIDDLFILDRVMSEEEIYDLHASGEPFVGDNNLIMYFPFGNTQRMVIANFRDHVDLTHIFNEDNSLGAFSANLVNEFDFTLFYVANPIAIDDAIYFGADQPFKHVVMYITTPGDFHATVLAEISNGGGVWEPLTSAAFEMTCYQNDNLRTALHQRRLFVVNIIDASTWAIDTVNLIANKFWLRLRISAFTNWTTSPIHGTQLVYTAKTNELRIPAASLHGDAPPTMLMRMVSPDGGDENPWAGNLSRIVWGIKSRGLSSFVAYLNTGNSDNPAGWTTAYGDDTSQSADPDAPGGYRASCSFATDETLDVRVTLTGDDKLEYWLGDYRVYVIAQQIGGVDGDVSLMLRTYIGGTNAYDPHIDTETIPLTDTGLGLEVVYLGKLNIPLAEVHDIDDFSAIDIIFQIFASRAAGSAAALRLYALVLIPIDEASGAPDDGKGDITAGSFALRGDEAVDHDGGIIRRGTKKVAIDGVNHRAIVEWDSGGAFVSTEYLDAARIYFLFLHYPVGGTWGTGPMIATLGCTVIGELQAHHRYRLLRGSD